ncbi:unnamed protein product [Trifolium pratense]|uniref:Uncharacterized protein n=1 Tax=Trifolium pratense TaxID=57577 RepID=A0ACB0KAP7_TRIPR|nr:unnamed protein product [Trifolium pratense]
MLVNFLVSICFLIDGLIQAEAATASGLIRAGDLLNATSAESAQFKCNIDASFASHLNKVVIGIYICDNHGQFVLSKHKLVNLDFSNIRRLICKVRNCIMAKIILKTSIEMMCLDDPNEMNFLPKLWFIVTSYLMV